MATSLSRMTLQENDLAISDNEQIFHAEFELNNEEDIIGVQPFAVSGTNPIDQDVHLTIEKDPELLTEYNYNTYMDETDKYARELKERGLFTFIFYR